MNGARAYGNKDTDILIKLIKYIFYSLFVKDKKFYAKDDCIGCGLCERLCPMDNIEIKNGKPVWKGGCTHCMACICSCPESAIEYGKISAGKPRYKCPED